MTESGIDAEFLASTEVFATLPADVVADLVESAEPVHLQTGDVLVREGDPADAVYIVRHGRMRTWVVSGGERVVIGEIGRGEVVGEMALLTDHVRTATVEALRDSVLVRIEASVFSRVLAEHPGALRPVAATLVERLRRAVRRSDTYTVPSTVAVVPMSAEAAQWLGPELERSLSGLGLAVASLSPTVDGGERPLADLLETEAANDMTLLFADAVPNDWTRQCARQAELILLVAAPGDRTSLSPVEMDGQCADENSRVHTELVLLRSQSTRAARWLRERSVERHHNIDPGRDADAARLARLIAGRSLAIVLSGGGARGLAHVGVLDALQNAGIEIDAIGGTSAGALVAGGYAKFCEVEPIKQRLKEFVDEVRWAADLTVPAVALLNGRRMTEALRGAYGETLIEDLSRGYFAVSTNLTDLGPRVHVTGPLWRAVRASASVPGLFPPVREGDHLLVDGGVVDNLPTETMRSRYPAATVVAFDVGSSASDLQVAGHSPEGITSGWGILGRRLRGSSSSAASMPRILARLTELGRQDADSGAADLVVSPAVEEFGLLEGKAFEELISAGRRAGEQAVEWIEGQVSAHDR